MACSLPLNIWCAFAETIRPDLLDPLVVTASPIPRTHAQTSASVTVIPREEIDRQHANRLATVLQRVPGVFVDEMGGRGGTSSLYIRGGDPNFTLVMIDGIPLNDSSNQRGGSVDLSTLTPERIARIEVVRGPASVQYGSDAMAGMVNLITHTGQEQPSYRTRIEGGSFGYARGTLHAEGTKEHLHYSGTAALTRNDALAKGDSYASGNVGGTLDWSKQDAINLRLTGQYSSTNTRLFPEGSGGTRLAILRDLEDRHTHEMVTGLTLSQELSRHLSHELWANVLYRQQEIQNPGVKRTTATFEIPPTNFITRFTRYRLGGTAKAMISSDWKIAGGWQVIIEHGKRTGTQQLTALGFPIDVANAFQTTRTTPAGFMETSFSPISAVILTAGIRIDSPEAFPITINPRAGLTVQVTPHTTLRANYGQGFKLPSFNALSDPVIGNASLNPESSQTWDVGIRQSLWSSQLALELTYFHNRFKNLIDLDPLLASQGTFTLVNLNTVETRGIEFGFTATPNSVITVMGSYTYLEADVLGSGAVLRNRPKNTGTVVIDSQPFPSFRVRGQVRVIGPRTDFQVPTRQTVVPGFVRIDLSTTYKIMGSWSVFGVIENLLNASYEEYAGFQAPGIWARLGLTYAHEG